MINKILFFLNNVFENEGYYVKEFSDGLFFGKDKNNNVICAKNNSSKETSFSLKTKAIELYQNYHFILMTENEEINGNYDMLILNNTFVDTKKTFVNLCLNFYNEESDKSIVDLTNDLIEMYKLCDMKSEKTEQGLWGELFTVLYIKNKFNINIAEYWHNDNFNKYDFSLNSSTKLEVKTTKRECREHKFSHEQLYTDYDVIISSIQMRKDDNGYTILDLYSQVESLFNIKYDLLIRIEKILVQFDVNALEKYDFEYAGNNIKFFLNKYVPHIPVSEPNGIHGTEYTVVLEGQEPLKEETVKMLLDRSIYERKMD